MLNKIEEKTFSKNIIGYFMKLNMSPPHGHRMECRCEATLK